MHPMGEGRGEGPSLRWPSMGLFASAVLVACADCVDLLAPSAASGTPEAEHHRLLKPAEKVAPSPIGCIRWERDGVRGLPFVGRPWDFSHRLSWLHVRTALICWPLHQPVARRKPSMIDS